MFIKNKICEKCQKGYDNHLDYCPHCKENNQTRDRKRFEGVTYYEFWRQIIIFVIGAFLLSVVATIISAIFSSFDLNELKATAIINFLTYAIVFVALLLSLLPEYRPLLKSFKGYKPYVFALAGLGAILMFNYVYLTIIGLIYPISDNANESAINSIVPMYPILSILIFGIVGPLVEEMTYRLGLFSFFKRINTILAYAITMIIFALIHFDFYSFTSGTYINELINLPSYLAAAFVLTFLYDKFGFASSSLCHIANNMLSIMMTIIMSLLPENVL